MLLTTNAIANSCKDYSHDLDPLITIDLTMNRKYRKYCYNPQYIGGEWQD